MLQANPIIRTVVDLLSCGTTVEYPLALPGNRLGEMTEPIPLTTLFFLSLSTWAVHAMRKNRKTYED